MKNLILVVLTGIIQVSLYGQFQSRIIEIPDALSYSGNLIIYDDDGFIIQTFTYPTQSPTTAFGLIKTDFEGNLTWSNHIDSLSSDNEKHTVLTNDSFIVTAGHHHEEKEKNIQIIKIDKESGNTVEVVSYGSGWSGERCMGLFKYVDGYILSMTIPVEGSQSSRRPVLVRFDEAFNIIWEKELSEPEYDIYRTTNIWSDVQNNIYYSARDGFSNFNHTIVGKLSSEGDDIWFYKHPIPNLQISGGEGTLLSEGNLLIFNRPEDETSPWDWFNRVPSLMRLSPDGEFINEFPIQNKYSKYHNFVFEKGNSELIIGGSGQDSDAYESNRFEGWLVAYNNDNERLWQRLIIDNSLSPFSPNFVTRNSLITGLELPDNSLVFVGWITSDPSNPQFSGRIWFLRTDSEGCLEPDCGYLQIIDEEGNYSTTTATEDIQNNPSNPHSVQISPNPAETFISVSLLGEHPEIKYLELVDVNGKILRTYETRLLGNDFKLDLPKTAQGVCYLRAFTDAGNWVKKVMVVK